MLIPRPHGSAKMLTLGALAASLCALVGCADPKPVSDAELQQIDEQAMSLRLDRTDVDYLYETNLEHLQKSELLAQWAQWAQSDADDAHAAVGVFPMSHHTGQEIDRALKALQSKLEAALAQTGIVEVVSLENQAELIAEVKRQHSMAYEPTRIARMGRQIGARYILTGKAYDVAEAVEGERRVQYLLVVQVIEVETGEVKFEHRSELTRAVAE